MMKAGEGGKAKAVGEAAKEAEEVGKRGWRLHKRTSSGGVAAQADEQRRGKNRMFFSLLLIYFYFFGHGIHIG